MITEANPTEEVLREALAGLTASPQKTLPPWLFYDERGSQLFEEITTLPEYYLTRTERAIFAAHAEAILRKIGAEITIAELGAGTASKTGILLRAATRLQKNMLYQPVDVSSSALDEAAATLSSAIPLLTVHPQVANYITERYTLKRPKDHRILALYIGSSIGNFSPAEASSILNNLRAHLEPNDALLLGADLAPGTQKSVSTLLAAYDDAAGVTAAFNKNILARLNRELDAGFNLEAFAHRVRWNAAESRIEMHLESLTRQAITLPIGGKPRRIDFARGETIHTENSYKFTEDALTALLTGSGFMPIEVFHDFGQTFAVTLAQAV